MNRRHFSGTLLQSLIAPICLGLSAGTAQAQALAEGKNFALLKTPQPQLAGGKIEVLEFFSYGCHACNAFEPQLENWARALPADVQLRRVPVPFLANALNFQKTYYALESMGLVERLQRGIFAAVHVERLALDKLDDIAALVGRLGGDAQKFRAAFQSFTVATAVTRAKKLSSDYAIQSIPTLAIHGRYTTSPSQAGAATLAVVDALIQRERGKS